jgi:hypothetical protein
MAWIDLLQKWGELVLLIVAIVFLVGALALEVSWIPGDYLNKIGVMEYILKIGGIVVAVASTTTIMWVVMRRKSQGLMLGFDKLVKGRGEGFFGGDDWPSFPNHPFFVTGSSEYNDKTVSDNYLPTL